MRGGVGTSSVCDADYDCGWSPYFRAMDWAYGAALRPNPYVDELVR